MPIDSKIRSCVAIYLINARGASPNLHSLHEYLTAYSIQAYNEITPAYHLKWH